MLVTQCEQLIDHTCCPQVVLKIGVHYSSCTVCSSLYGKRCLNCVLTGNKKAKLSSKGHYEHYDDDDDDTDVPLPIVDVQLTTDEFYEQHKEKVFISFLILSFILTPTHLQFVI